MALACNRRRGNVLPWNLRSGPRHGSADPMTRRSALRIAALAVPGLLAAGASISASAAPQSEAGVTKSAPGGVGLVGALSYRSGARPTGPALFAIEDLGVGHDLQAALNKVARLAASPTLTLPIGAFECRGFAQSRGYIGFLVPPNVSLIGSGRGTIVRVAANTVTPEQVERWVPPDRPLGTSNSLQVVRVVAGRSPVTLSNLSIQGTPQTNPGSGRAITFHGLCVARCPSPTLSDLYLRGVPGSLNSPPGETFGVNLLGGSGASLYNVEVDGRVVGGSRKVGGCGIGVNSSSGVMLYACSTHDMGYSHGISFWQSSNVTTYGLRSYNNGTGTANGGGGGSSGAGINHEKTRSSQHFAPQLSGNSLAVLRYWASARKTGDGRSGDTTGHTVANAAIPASDRFTIRIDGEQSSTPVLVGCPAPAVSYR